MHRDGQIVLGTILPDGGHARIEHGHAVIDGAELDALELQILDGVNQQIHGVSAPRVDGGKADEFVGVFGDGAGSSLIRTVNAGAVGIFGRVENGLIDLGEFGIDRVAVRYGSDRPLSRHRGASRKARLQLIGVPDVHMAIDKHGKITPSVRVESCQPRRRITSAVIATVSSMSASVCASEMLDCLVATGKWKTPASIMARR